VSDGRVDEFVRDFVSFSRGKIISDDRHASGVEIGRPDETYHRIPIDSNFGKMTVLATDGHLPYPYGREMTGYEVADLRNTLTRGKAAGATILVGPYTADRRQAAIICFPAATLLRSIRWTTIRRCRFRQPFHDQSLCERPRTYCSAGELERSVDTDHDPAELNPPVSFRGKSFGHALSLIIGFKKNGRECS
jgi:hypothetical protein